MGYLRRLVTVSLLALTACSHPGAVQAATPTVVVDPRPASNSVRSSPAIFATASTWLYGDSLTVQTWRNLKVSGGLAVDAYWGRASYPTAQRLTADLRYATHRPTVVVMAVGTNDFADPDALTAAIAAARRASITYGFRLVWVSVYTDNRDDEAGLNARIAAGGPLVQVADWYGLLAANVGEDGRSLWLVDGTHVNAEGAVWRTNLLYRAITTQPRATVTVTRRLAGVSCPRAAGSTCAPLVLPGR